MGWICVHLPHRMLFFVKIKTRPNINSSWTLWISVVAGWTSPRCIYLLPLRSSWHCPPSPFLGGSPIRGGRAESAAPHPGWCHGGMLAQRAAGTNKPGMGWKAERMRCGWGVRVGGIEVGLVIPVTALCGMDSPDPRPQCVCVQVYLMHLSLCPCGNVAIQRTAPFQGSPPRTWIEPLTPAAANKHTQAHTAPTPWGAAGASSGGLWRGKKSFQEDSHLLLSCCRPWAGKKTPLFLPLSPFLAIPAKKLGRAALWKERKAGRQQIPLSVCTAKRNGLI